MLDKQMEKKKMDGEMESSHPNLRQCNGHPKLLLSGVRWIVLFSLAFKFSLLRAFSGIVCAFGRKSIFGSC